MPRYRVDAHTDQATQHQLVIEVDTPLLPPGRQIKRWDVEDVPAVHLDLAHNPDPAQNPTFAQIRVDRGRIETIQTAGNPPEVVAVHDLVQPRSIRHFIAEVEADGRRVDYVELRVI